MAGAGERDATLDFPNGNRPAFVAADGAAEPADLLRQIHLDRSRPTIVVCGGAAGLDKERRLFRASLVLGPAVLRAAKDNHAAIVDGGTESGVMHIVGKERWSQRAEKDVLLGVAPDGRTFVPKTAGEEKRDRMALESHHTHFVLAQSDKWGGETALLFELAGRLSHDARAVVVLLRGGKNAKGEVLEAVRRGWPVAVVRGFGGFSRTLLVGQRVVRAARRLRLARLFRWLGNRINPELRHMLETGRFGFVGGGPEALARWIDWELRDLPMLKRAWSTFAAYDTQANVLQRLFRDSQRAILAIGVAATAFVTFWDWTPEEQGAAPQVIAAILPALVALLISLAARRAFGKRWIVLRAAAESVKAETFRYRTRTGPYRTARSRDAVLSERLGAIRAELLATEAAAGRLSFTGGPGPPPALNDEGLADLSAKDYAGARIANQIRYYHGTVHRKILRRNVLQTAALAIGASGSLIAAFGGEPWVAVTTAVSAAAASYLATRQHEQDVLSYNQTAADLEATYDDWLAASGQLAMERAAVAVEGRLELTGEGTLEVDGGAVGVVGGGVFVIDRDPQLADDDVMERLVDRTESILTEEVGAWARRMARVLEEQAERQREHGTHGPAA